MPITDTYYTTMDWVICISNVMKILVCIAAVVCRLSFCHSLSNICVFCQLRSIAKNGENVFCQVYVYQLFCRLHQQKLAFSFFVWCISQSNITITILNVRYKVRINNFFPEIISHCMTNISMVPRMRIMTERTLERNATFYGNVLSSPLLWKRDNYIVIITHSSLE